MMIMARLKKYVVIPSLVHENAFSATSNAAPDTRVFACVGAGIEVRDLALDL